MAAEARKFHILHSAVSFKNTSTSLGYQIHTSVFPWQIRVTWSVIAKEKQGGQNGFEKKLLLVLTFLQITISIISSFVIYAKVMYGI